MKQSLTDRFEGITVGELMRAGFKQEQIEEIASMNRRQKRDWLKGFRRRGKGYTR